MLYVLSIELLISYTAIIIGWIERPNLATNVGVMALTLLPESMKTLTSLGWPIWN